MGCSKVQRHLGPERMADEHRSIDAEVMKRVADERGIVGGPPHPGRERGFPEAGKVERDDPEASREAVEHGGHRLDPSSPSVKDDHREPFAGVVDTGALALCFDRSGVSVHGGRVSPFRDGWCDASETTRMHGAGTSRTTPSARLGRAVPASTEASSSHWSSSAGGSGRLMKYP